MSTLAVKLTWNRLGRTNPSNPRRDGFEELVTIVDDDRPGDHLADAIMRIARKWLLSSDVWVDVWTDDTLDTGRFMIGAGRYGDGRWSIVSTISDGKEPDGP